MPLSKDGPGGKMYKPGMLPHPGIPVGGSPRMFGGLAAGATNREGQPFMSRDMGYPNKMRKTTPAGYSDNNVRPHRGHYGCGRGYGHHGGNKQKQFYGFE